MKKIFQSIFLFILLLFLQGVIWAQGRISYIYPAGGQQGTTFEIVVSGNGVNANTKKVFVTGEGVTIKFKRACFRDVNVSGATEGPVFDYLFQKAMNRCYPDRYKMPKEPVRISNPTGKEIVLASEESILNSYPWVSYLGENIDLEIQKRMLAKIYYEYFSGKRDRQRSLSPFIYYEVTIAPDARPGLRELRFFQSEGGLHLSTPFFFEVTPYKEVCEIEPNDSLHKPKTVFQGRFGFHYGEMQLEPQDTPVVFNGQVCAGEWDYLSFKAKKGQQLVLGVKGRSIVPYMADAVPGWFSPIITLYDEKGNRIASECKYRFSTDPIYFFDVPKDGIYQVEIRDIIYRGREDFVYRLFIGEIPFVQSTSLLGTVKETNIVKLKGLNLPTDQLDLNVVKQNNKKNGKIHDDIKELYWTVDRLDNVWLPWPLIFANDDIKAYSEEYLRETMKESGREKPMIQTPIIIDGVISRDDEEDIWYFKGAPGRKIVMEVMASRLGSPMEPGVELRAPSGKILVRGDDRAGAEGPNIGQETYHADPLTYFTLTETGDYAVHVYNVFGKGGQEYRYRLRISRPSPDFEIFATPSFINPGNNNSFKVKLDIIRKDGFTGPIKLYAKSEYGLFTVDGDVQAGVSSQYSTITCNSTFKELYPFYMIAEAYVDKKPLLHIVTPCEDMEQAFIYHHAIPCQCFSIYKQGRSELFFWPVDKNPVILSPGNISKCTLYLPDLPEMDPNKAVKMPLIPQKIQNNLDFNIKEPKGVILENFEVRKLERQVDLYLRLDEAGDMWRKTPPLGNLIINLSVGPLTSEVLSSDKTKLNDRGPVPAIPYQIDAKPVKRKVTK